MGFSSCTLIYLAGLSGYAGWLVRRCVRYFLDFPGEVLHSELLSELVAEETGFLCAQMSVGIRQGPELGYGEFCGPQNGVHVCFPHHLLRQLDATRLRKQLSER